MGEQPSDAVTDLGGLTGQVVVESDQNLEFSQSFFADVHPSQCVGHGPGGVGDDVGVSGVGLGLTRVQVSDSAHRQTRQIGHVMTLSAGDRDRQCADRSRLIDDHEHASLASQAIEELDQPGFVVGQRRVVQPFPGRAQRGGVMAVFADVQTAKHLVVRSVRAHARLFPAPPGNKNWVAGQASMAGSHVTKRPTSKAVGRVPISGPSTPPSLVTTPPGSSQRQGKSVMPDRATTKSPTENREKGNGVWRRVLPGICATFNGALNERQRLQAATLHCGDGSQITGTAALRVIGVRYVPKEPRVQVLVQMPARRKSSGFVLATSTNRHFTPRDVREDPERVLTQIEATYRERPKGFSKVRDSAALALASSAEHQLPWRTSRNSKPSSRK